MTPPIESYIDATAQTRIQVGLAPVQNIIHSLLLLTNKDSRSGLGDWVIDTSNQLSEVERRQHYLVMIGFYHAIMPIKNWSSFPVYLNHLATIDPEKLRDKILDTYFEFPVMGEVEEDFDYETALSSEENYLTFLRQRFEEKKIEEDVERWAYPYMIDPPAMQELIVAHLAKFWDGYLAEEWERVRPILQKAVNAFRKVDYSQMDNLEAAEFILGQPLNSEYLEKRCQEADRLFFAPSLHVGPYIGKFSLDDGEGFFFGARLPDDAEIYSVKLSHAELYVRLNALADETRLRILKYISDEGEACSTEIKDALDLSQSSASRHLTQLTATGYLIARRKDGAKCYHLDKERIEDTLETIRGFLKL